MKVSESSLRLSATDLANHLACRHLSELNHACAAGRIAKPSLSRPILEQMQPRGLRHEGEYLDALRGKGRDVLVIDTGNEELAREQTLTAMRQGQDVVAQAGLACGQWRGRAER